MDRQQAKELLPIIQAFAEGKIIQSRRINGMWIDLSTKTALNIISLIDEPQKYRIKPEPKYRPFKDAEECWQEMQKHKPFGWVKDKNKEDGTYVMVTKVSDGRDDMVINGNYNWRLDGLLKCFTFADGTPFGIKEE